MSPSFEDDDRRALAVILGRAGSRGLPGKNARPLHGRPLVAYTIDAACAADTVARVVLSTDGDAIARAGRAAGVAVIMRPAALATDDATVARAARHAVEVAGGDEPFVVVLYANVPVRPDDLIDRAVRTLAQSGADSVQSYGAVGRHHPYWMACLDGEGRVAPWHANTIDRRQDLPAVHLPDGGVIAVTRASLLSSAAPDEGPHDFFGADRRGIVNPPGSVVDVDDDADMRFAEFVLTMRRPAAAGSAR